MALETGELDQERTIDHLKEDNKKHGHDKIDRPIGVKFNYPRYTRR